MNPLTEGLPTAVEVGGETYGIRSDFRTAITAMCAMEDNELAEEEKLALLLHLIYVNQPEDTAEALSMAIKFLNCGESRTGEGGEKLYSFSQDARYIYSAIQQTYGIDLSAQDLHWWRFCYLFGDLGDCFFTNMLSLRKRRNEGRLTKEEKVTYGNLRDILDLPETRTADEQSAYEHFMSQLDGGESLGAGRI